MLVGNTGVASFKGADPLQCIVALQLRKLKIRSGVVRQNQGQQNRFFWGCGVHRFVGHARSASENLSLKT
jgi:hypothetical protein